jgi:hypothetical protein
MNSYHSKHENKSLRTGPGHDSQEDPEAAGDPPRTGSRGGRGAWAGILKLDKSTDELIDEMRGPAALP